jgi:hypothetical protein
MHMNRRTLPQHALLGVAAALLIAGCASPGGGPPAASDKGSAQLWTENCGRCHNLRSPSIYGDAAWDVVVHQMRVRANLTTAEELSIAKFLKAGN